MGGIFGAIVQWQQFNLSIAAFKGTLNEQIGKPGIFWQDRTVGIGAEDIFVDCAFDAIFAIIAPARQYFAQWLAFGPRYVRPL